MRKLLTMSKEIAGRLFHGRPVRTLLRSALVGLLLAAVASAVLYLVVQAQRAPVADARDEAKADIIISEMLRAPDALVIGSKVGELRVLNPNSGAERFRATLPQAELHGLAAFSGALFAAQDREIVRLDGRLRVQRVRAVGGVGVRTLAGGPFGLFALERETGALLCINSRTLHVSCRMDSLVLGGTPRALTVTRFAVWIVLNKPDVLVRLTRDPVSGRLEVDKRVPVSGGASTMAIGNGYVAVLSPRSSYAMLVDVDDIGATKTFRVEAGAYRLAIGNGSLWVLSGRDVVSQRRLRNGRRVGDPIAVGSDPLDVAVSLQAVWTSSAGSAVLTRLDLRRLPALRHPPAQATVFGVNRWMLLGVSIFCFVLCIVMGLLFDWVNPYRRLPRYQTGAALRLLALNAQQAAWLLAERRVKRVDSRLTGGVRTPLFEFEVGGGDGDEVEGETVEELLHRQLVRGCRRRIFSRELGWAMFGPGWRFGRSRRQRLPPLRQRHAQLSIHDVLIDGHVWTVVANIGGGVQLVSSRVRDPHLPDGKGLAVPPGGEIIVIVEDHHLHALGQKRLAPGTKVALDIIATPTPSETPSVGLHCELVMAFQTIQHARPPRGRARRRRVA